MGELYTTHNAKSHNEASQKAMASVIADITQKLTQRSQFQAEPQATLRRGGDIPAEWMVPTSGHGTAGGLAEAKVCGFGLMTRHLGEPTGPHDLKQFMLG
jgi:hypothetical protein